MIQVNGMRHYKNECSDLIFIIQPFCVAAENIQNVLLCFNDASYVLELKERRENKKLERSIENESCTCDKIQLIIQNLGAS